MSVTPTRIYGREANPSPSRTYLPLRRVDPPLNFLKSNNSVPHEPITHQHMIPGSIVIRPDDKVHGKIELLVSYC